MPFENCYAFMNILKFEGQMNFKK